MESERRSQMTKLWRHEYRDFFRSPVPSPPAIVEEGILPVQSRMIIGGEENVGKTILATQLALDIASGMSFLRLFDVPKPRKVLMIQAEVAEPLFQRRLAKSVKIYSRKIRAGYLHFAGPGMELNTKTGSDLFMTMIDESKAEVIVIDPTYKFYMGNENDAGEVKRFLHVLDSALSEYGVSVILTHHMRKPFISQSGKVIRVGLADFRGSSVLTGWADSRIMMINNAPKVTLDMELRHATSKPPRVIMTLDRKTALFTAEIPGGATAAEQQVLAIVASGTRRYAELVTQSMVLLNVSRRHVERIIASCRSKGLISQGVPKLLIAGPMGTSWQTEEDEISVPIGVDDGDDDD